MGILDISDLHHIHIPGYNLSLCVQLYGFFKALRGAICEVSFYRPAVCVGFTLTTIRHQRAKVTWCELSRDYQVSDFIRSSFCLSPRLCFIYFLYPAAWPASPLYFYLSISFSPLFQSLSKKKDGFFWLLLKKLQQETHVVDVRTKKSSLGGKLFPTEEEESISMR